MTNVSLISAQLLKESRRTIAELVCTRLEDSARNQVTARSAERIQWIERTETLVHVLAAAISLSSQTLWENYVRWANSLPQTDASFDYSLTSVLRELVAVVDVELPDELSIVIKDYITCGIEALRKLEPELPQPDAEDGPASLQADYLAALLATRRDAALGIVLNAVNAGMAIESVYLDILQPTQHELGRLWQSGRISVAQEHYCTAATQFVMSQLQPYFLAAKPSNRTLIATCVGDELHEVGLRIVTDLFEVQGWNTIYLGANTPPNSIAEAIVSSGAEVLALSTTMTQHLFGVVEVIQAVRAHPDCRQVKVLVGGYPFNADSSLWQRVGADAMASDARQAIQVVNRLLGEQAAAVSSSQPAPAPQTKIDARLACSDTHDDLSRLNNSLVTLQRQLNQTNVQLAASNKAKQEKSLALEQADRRKDEFLAMLAHELRGPLAPMEFALALMEMENIDPAVVQESRETIKRQLHQMKRLISDLLDASRIAHGKIELQNETLDLKSVLERAVQIARPLIQEKQQTLLLDYSDAILKIDGDEVRLTQVFANLLTNASKYTPAKGTIWLSTEEVQGAAVIKVKDNGVGIEEDWLPNMFSTFAQEQRSRQHSRGGLGLGLSLVKQLVELHAGHVAAESLGAGQGSTFTVTLPNQAKEPAEHSLITQGNAQPADNGPARRVLIVEDTAGIARITALLFEQLGHLPDIALNGATAIAKVKRSAPEIVVLDLELPDMSGLDVAREIRRMDSSNSILIVALTGHQDAKHRELAQQSGCDEYFVKPVVVKRLRELATHPKLMVVH